MSTPNDGGPDQFQTTENLLRVASEACAWIGHLNVLAASLEGKIRGYYEVAKSLPASPESMRLVKYLASDLESIEELHRRGPIFNQKHR